VAQPSADRLSLLYRVSQTFNSSLDLDEVLNHVIDEVIAVTRAERGFLMLRGADGQLAFRVARGLDHRTIDEPDFEVSRTVVERVAREGRPLLTSNAQSDAWLKERTSIVALGLRSILCVPLQIKGATLGVAYVDNRLQAGIFTDGDLELLTAIAASAASAIENARLYQVAVDKGRMERELQVAREVQAGLIPRERPRVPGWEFASRWRPAREVAGDYYDFIDLASINPAKDAQPSPGLGVVIADVTDKGMPAALFMALSRSIIRASLISARSPVEGITQANRLIYADATNAMFVTLFYAQLDSTGGQVTYVNAGHNPPLAYHADRRELISLTRTGMVLGALDEAGFEQRTTHLQPGDFIVMYTDGVTEALDVHGQEFGEARLRRVVLDHGGASAAELVAAVDRALDDFLGAASPSDDTTLVVVKRVLT
jgi:sigma-B regulation protein RsbU (phosphoserine phosphatase)